MNQTDKISKEVFNLFNYSKDVVKNNVVNMNLNLSTQQLNNLLDVIDNSIDQSYHRSLTNFQKNIDTLIKK